MDTASRVPAAAAGRPAGHPSPPAVVWLDEPGAEEPALTGSKSANLAVAAAAGLPVLPGFAVTTAVTAGGLDPAAVDDVRAAWAALQERHPGPVVVRSSSTGEDTGTASMAGQFTSVLDVEGWDACREAIGEVIDSAAHPKDASPGGLPMAVLVQPLVAATVGGVLFGLDPVGGERRHLVVEAVRGGPESLVSGTTMAAHATLSRRGRLLGASSHDAARLLGRALRRRLARMAGRAGRAFGGPQDVEWAVDADGRLWLLQSRAVTAAAAGPATGPVLGPGPVAETFPEPLRRLEQELWLEPLRAGVAAALGVIGAVPPRRIAASPVVCAVGGWAAADLELFGIVPRAGRAKRLVDPERGVRRLLAAWRVGRLRAALPALAGDLVAFVDADLTAVGDLRDRTDAELVGLLGQARGTLTSLHGHEVLAGMLLRSDETGGRTSALSAALAAVAQGRAAGLDDAAIAARAPVTLALVPPAIGGPQRLPPAAPSSAGLATDVAGLDARDALRVRARWVQELTVRASEELARRLAARGALADVRLVQELTLVELEVAASAGGVPGDLASRAAIRAGPPLPAAFRLQASGAPQAVVGAVSATGRDGLPASAGRAAGAACHDPASVAPDGRSVLVVDTLDPRFAAVLGNVAAIVSETGSALSHLAIVARELGVPAVVAVPDARRRFPPGSTVLVDGDAGEVELLAGEARP